MFYYVSRDGAIWILLYSALLIGAKCYMVLACVMWKGKKVVWKEDTYHNLKMEKRKWCELE